MPQYTGVSGVARKVTKAYVGVGEVARKISKKYVGVNGVARQYFSGAPDVSKISITYTGTMTDQVVAMSGVQYRLLTLTTSGTLNVGTDVNAEVWMCSGGSSGISSYGSRTGYGTGGGAGGFVATGNVVLSGGMSAVVGAGGKAIDTNPYYSPGTASSFANIITPVNFSYKIINDLPVYTTGISGGTGGGCGHASMEEYGISKGDGVSKYPFNDSTYFPNPHCAGGGGGSGFYDYTSLISHRGGTGGTNGGDGSVGTFFLADVDYPSVGGSYGGGYCPGVTSDGTNGTFYGAGGGGAGYRSFLYNSKYYYLQYLGGSGYQGVIYIRIPMEQ